MMSKPGGKPELPIGSVVVQRLRAHRLFIDNERDLVEHIERLEKYAVRQFYRAARFKNKALYK